MQPLLIFSSLGIMLIVGVLFLAGYILGKKILKKGCNQTPCCSNKKDCSKKKDKQQQ